MMIKVKPSAPNISPNIPKFPKQHIVRTSIPSSDIVGSNIVSKINKADESTDKRKKEPLKLFNKSKTISKPNESNNIKDTEDENIPKLQKKKSLVNLKRKTTIVENKDSDPYKSLLRSGTMKNVRHSMRNVTDDSFNKPIETKKVKIQAQKKFNRVQFKPEFIEYVDISKRGDCSSVSEKNNIEYNSKEESDKILKKPSFPLMINSNSSKKVSCCCIIY